MSVSVIIFQWPQSLLYVYHGLIKFIRFTDFIFLMILKNGTNSIVFNKLLRLFVRGFDYVARKILIKQETSSRIKS